MISHLLDYRKWVVRGKLSWLRNPSLLTLRKVSGGLRHALELMVMMVPKVIKWGGGSLSVYSLGSGERIRS